MRSEKLAASLLIFACVFATTGCRTVAVSDSVLPRLAGNGEQAQLDYWHELATRTLVSNDDAFHGVLLYVDGADPNQSYEQRVAALKSRRLLPSSFNRPASEALQRGTLAVAVVKMLQFKGGVTMRMFGSSPRYAIRELEYRNLFPQSSTNQIFTGAEFVGVIGKVQDFRAGNPANVPAAVMPAEVHAKRPPPTVADLALAIAHLSDEELARPRQPIFAMFLAQDLSLQPPASPAATAPSAGAARSAVISGVEAIASVRDDENSPWKPAVKGMQLTERAEVRTGPRGAVQLIIPPDETISVDRLTQLKLLRVFREGQRAATELGVTYGRTRYDLEGGGLEHQSTLRSPNATLAVRGTRVSLFDQRPYTPEAISLTGRAEFRAFRRQAIAFGNRGQGRTRITSNTNSPGEVALSETVVDPSLAGARSESESALIATVLSRGATFTIDRESGIKIVRGGVPPTDAELVPALPGQLNFVLRWHTDANLDLGVSTAPTLANPGGEFVYPAAGLNVAPSGGTTVFDHRGGQSGGIEVVYFNTFSTGVYGLGARRISGAPGTETVRASFEGFLDGKPVQLTNGVDVGFTIEQDVDSFTPGLVLASVGSDFPPGAVGGAAPLALRSPLVKHPVSLLKPESPAVPIGPFQKSPAQRTDKTR